MKHTQRQRGGRLVVLLALLLSFVYQARTQCTFAQPLRVETRTDGNYVQWDTRTEIGVLRHVVECSIDGIDFYPVGIFSDPILDEADQRYRSLDARTSFVRVFYRVRTLMIDERVSYSSTVIANRTQQNTFLITAISNLETDGWLGVTVTAEAAADLRYQLIDRFGRTVRKGNIQMLAGENTFDFDCSDLAVDRYELVLTNGLEEERIWFERISEDELLSLVE